MSTEFAEAFRSFLIDALTVQKAGSSKYAGNPVAQAFYNGRVATLEHMNSFVTRFLKSQEELTMEKVKLEFGDLIDLDEIEKKDRVKEDSMQALILKEAPNVRPGKARIVKSDVKWGSFSNAVYKLVRQGKLDKGYVPIEDKNGNQYLALKRENGAKK